MGRKRKSSSFEAEDRKGFSKSSDAAFVRSDALRSNTANERERARMRVLSKAFVRLKTSLPWVPPDTKLSKLDTLRLASRYIAHLRRLLAIGDSGDVTEHGNIEQDSINELRLSSDCERLLGSDDIHPINLSWPFISSLRKSSVQGQSNVRSADLRTTTTTTTSSSSSPLSTPATTMNTLNVSSSAEACL